MNDLLDPAPRAAQAPPEPAVLARPVAALFAVLSRLRGIRAMHPHGVVFAARLRVPPPAPDAPAVPAAWLALDGAPAVLRASRGAGLPEPLPDVLGLALRAGPQDLLLSTGGRGPLLRHLPAPAGRFMGPLFSSLFAYEVEGRRLRVTGRLRAARPAAGGSLAALAQLAGEGLTLELSLSDRAERSWPLGRVEVDAVLDTPAARAVRFDPFRAGAGLVPSGLPMDVRAPAYAGSRRGSAR